MGKRGEIGSVFDGLARSLAAEVPRREALRRLGGGLAAAMLASLGLKSAWGQSGNSCSERALSRCLEQAAALCNRQLNLCLLGAGNNAQRRARCNALYQACSQAGARECGGWFGCPSGQTCQNGRCVAECNPPCDESFGLVCINGTCQCQSPLAACGFACYDPTTQLCCATATQFSICDQPAVCCPPPDFPDALVCYEGTVCPTPGPGGNG